MGVGRVQWAFPVHRICRRAIHQSKYMELYTCCSALNLLVAESAGLRLPWSLKVLLNLRNASMMANCPPTNVAISLQRKSPKERERLTSTYQSICLIHTNCAIVVGKGEVEGETNYWMAKKELVLNGILQCVSLVVYIMPLLTITYTLLYRMRA